MTSTRTFHRKGSPSWRPDARPYVAAPVSSDDEWLAAACKAMMKGKGGMDEPSMEDTLRNEIAAANTPPAPQPATIPANQKAPQ